MKVALEETALQEEHLMEKGKETEAQVQAAQAREKEMEAMVQGNFERTHDT